MNTLKKSKPHIIAYLVTAFLALGSTNSKSQTTVKNSNWVINPVDHRVFIENRGQFDADVDKAEKVLFRGVMGNVKLYFTAEGVICRYDKKAEPANETNEDSDPEKMGDQPSEAHYLKAVWLGSNPGVIVEGQEESADYYTYLAEDKSTIKTFAFKKIIYHNLYPGIDLEYTFPKNKEGVEYAFLIHPGADAGKIKMSYDNPQSLALDETGNLNLAMVNSKVTDILDHAPKTFYNDTKELIASSFSVDGNVVSFKVNGYDKTKEVIIDPWSINPGFVSQDKAFDVAQDAAGNVYAYGGGGGGSAWSLKKFTPLGALVWTFTTTYASWFGNMAVDAVGNSYITEGCCGGGIQKISTGGVSLWSVNYGVYEFWLLAFDGTFTNLYLGCGYSSGLVPFESVSHLNTANGAITGGIALNAAGSEPRSIAWAPNGNLYFLTATFGAGGNDVIGITPAFAGIFSVPSGYALAYNGPTYANGSNPTSCQYGIAASKTTFIATSNGATLTKRNINTGAFVASIAIPGGVVEGNSGVQIDACGNIYVGSQTAVYEYDSLLNLKNTVATAGAVYCLYYAGNGVVLASGNGFIASLSFPVCGVVLPIHLNDFSCENEDKGIMLSWTTATETNNKYFTIERSIDGINYTPVKEITGAGNSVQTLHYSYLDENPLNGINYYRLSQTDFDGKTQSFSVTSCTANKLVAGSIFPNPASGSFTVTLGPSSEAQVVTIYDVLGRSVYNEQFPADAAYSNHIINVPQLNGVYLVHITGGSQNIVRKLLLK